MSWPPGGEYLANAGPFVEDPELSQAERESIAPLAEWIVAMVRDSESSVSSGWNWRQGLASGR
jgi:hypothetical protein